MAKYSDGNIYHIYNKGYDKELIFSAERDYKFLIRRMIHNSVNFNIKILAFCLLPDQFHLLLLQKPEGSISEYLKSTFASYTKAMNREEDRNEVIFDGGPKFVRVKEIDHLQNLIGYIHYSPVKSGLVMRPEKWIFSNYPEFIGKRSKYPFEPEFLIETFESPSKYKEFFDKLGKDNTLKIDFDKYLTE